MIPFFVNLGNKSNDILLDVLMIFMEKDKPLLHEAAEKGLVNVLDVLAKGGRNINSIDSVGKTPLNYAAANGMLLQVQHGRKKASFNKIHFD